MQRNISEPHSGRNQCSRAVRGNTLRQPPGAFRALPLCRALGEDAQPLVVTLCSWGSCRPPAVVHGAAPSIHPIPSSRGAQPWPHFRLGERRPGPRGSELMPNLLMELDSSGIKSTSEIATPLQSASALKELNQKRNLLAAGRVGRGARTQARTPLAPGRERWDPPFLLCSPNLFHAPSHKQRDPSTKPNPKGLWQ